MTLVLMILSAGFIISQNKDDLFIDYSIDTPNSVRGEKRNKSGLGIKNGNGIPVFFPVYNGVETSAVTDKFMQDIQYSVSVGDIVPLDTRRPPKFLDSCKGGGGTDSAAVKKRFAELKASRQPHLATELLKYCALQHYDGGLYLDSQSTLSITVDHLLTEMTNPKIGYITVSGNDRNIAVLNDPKISPDSIHGGLLYVRKKKSTKIVEGMISTLLSTDVKTLEKSPLLLSKTLYDLMKKDAPSKSKDVWYFLQHTCNLFSLGQRKVATPVDAYALNSYR